jgi:hypothetical protein
MTNLAVKVANFGKPRVAQNPSSDNKLYSLMNDPHYKIRKEIDLVWKQFDVDRNDKLDIRESRKLVNCVCKKIYGQGL